MNNFRVIRIDTVTGQAVLLYDLVSEDFAWKKVNHLERLESEKPFRYSWFAVTNIGDWQELARKFLNYRRELVIP